MSPERVTNASNVGLDEVKRTLSQLGMHVPPPFGNLENLSLDINPPKDYVEHMLENAIVTIRDLGMSDRIVERVPTQGKVKFKTLPAGMFGLEGYYDPLSGDITMYMPCARSLSNEAEATIVRQFAFHEIGHSLVERLVSAKRKKGGELELQYIARGFDRMIKHGPSQEVEANVGWAQPSQERGIFSEAYADIFSLFCANQSEHKKFVLASEYKSETLFMICLFERIAKVNNSSIKTEFGKAFEAYCLRDFGWYGHLVDSLDRYYQSVGVDVSEARQKALSSIKQMNNVNISPDDVANRRGLVEAQIWDLVENFDLESVFNSKVDGLGNRGGYIQIGELAIKVYSED